MCDRFEEWKEAISDYCVQNGLSFEKAKGMIKSSNQNMLLLQYHDEASGAGSRGLLDETPMPAVLWVTRQNGALRFEQTEYTKRYLGNL